MRTFTWLLGATLFVSLLNSPLLAGQGKTDFDRVAKEADKAFQSLEADVAQLDSSRQAEFRLLIKKEMASLEFDLYQAGKDSASVGRKLAIVRQYTDPLLDDSTADPRIKTMQFVDFMVGVRRRLGLMPVDSAAAITDSAKSTVTMTTLLTVTAGPVLSGQDIYEARVAANWSDNLKAVPKDWYKKMGTWTSDDGKVTFAVGQGQSRLASMAEIRASSHARNVLIRGDKIDGVALAPTGAISAIRYREGKKGMVYCLVAIPTSLLPR